MVTIDYLYQSGLVYFTGMLL